MLVDQRREPLVRNDTRAFGIDGHVHRLRDADGVGDLDLALARQAGRHDVLGHITRGICGGTVHLGRVLAAEGAAAVRAGAAIRVHNDLASGQATVALRAANHETAGGVDKVFGLLEPFLGQYRLDDLLDHRFDERRFHLAAVAHLGGVLARQHHGVYAVRLAVHITHRDLAFGVRAQERQAAVLAQLGLAFDQAVCVINRGRHQFGRLVAGITEHQALVAGAGVQMVVAGVVHTLRDVVALLVVGHQNGATFVVDAVFGIVVTDALERVARNLDVIHVRVGGDLTRQHHQAGVAQGLGCHARLRILPEDCVEDCVRDLVRNFVGVALGNGFRGKEKIVRHIVSCSINTLGRVA